MSVSLLPSDDFSVRNLPRGSKSALLLLPAPEAVPEVAGMRLMDLLLSGRMRDFLRCIWIITTQMLHEFFRLTFDNDDVSHTTH